MYTEENEFDYDDYLQEADDDSFNKSPFNRTLLTKIVLIVLCLILIIFLFFTITNSFKKEKKEETPVDSSLVFNNNINLLKTLGEKYFFEMENYPKEVGKNIKVNVRELIDGKLVTEIVDSNKKACGYNTSYISMTRNKNDYMLEIYLNCPSNSEKRVYYYDLEFNCLTCNGESYVSSDDDEEEEKPVEDNNNNNNNQNNNTTQVCSEFGNWTTEYKDDKSLDRQSRVVVKGFKVEIVYGNWSNETTTPIQGNSNLQVAVETRMEPTTTLSSWSKASTTKPQAKEGRTINSWTDSEPYYTESCKNKTYTQNRTTWDNNANKCTSTGIGKVTCTYTKKVCNTVKKYRDVTYYQYQDTITTTKSVTYYRSRTITQKTLYTDYILESNMPDGYTKLEGSERTEYRYRNACVK